MVIVKALDSMACPTTLEEKLNLRQIFMICFGLQITFKTKITIVVKVKSCNISCKQGILDEGKINEIHLHLLTGFICIITCN